MVSLIREIKGREVAEVLIDFLTLLKDLLKSIVFGVITFSVGRYLNRVANGVADGYVMMYGKLKQAKGMSAKLVEFRKMYKDILKAVGLCIFTFVAGRYFTRLSSGIADGTIKLLAQLGRSTVSSIKEGFKTFSPSTEVTG